MDSAVLEPLLRNGILVLDGGLATQLEAQGNDLADPLWSARLLAERPGEIVRAHLAFYRAGARVATTASYQAAVAGFARRGIGQADALDLIRSSVALASAAREAYRRECLPRDPGPLLVAASIGPFGAFLADGGEYRGRYGLGVDELVEFHRQRFEVLAGTDADLLACETIPEVEEVAALVRLFEETAGAVGWLSVTCADGAHLRSGAPLEAALGLVEGCPGIVAVGVNCTAPGHIDALLARARGATSKPLLVYPNSGEGWGCGGPNLGRRVGRIRRSGGSGRPCRWGRRWTRCPSVGCGGRPAHRRLLPSHSSADRGDRGCGRLTSGRATAQRAAHGATARHGARCTRCTRRPRVGPEPLEPSPFVRPMLTTTTARACRAPGGRPMTGSGGLRGRLVAGTCTWRSIGDG